MNFKWCVTNSYSVERAYPWLQALVFGCLRSLFQNLLTCSICASRLKAGILFNLRNLKINYRN